MGKKRDWKGSRRGGKTSKTQYREEHGNRNGRRRAGKARKTEHREEKGIGKVPGG